VPTGAIGADVSCAIALPTIPPPRNNASPAISRRIDFEFKVLPPSSGGIIAKKSGHYRRPSRMSSPWLTGSSSGHII
jgi:hypothetical protein